MGFSIYLNGKQIAHIAEVLGNLSILFLGSLILPAFMGESISEIVVLLGLILATGSFVISIQLLKGGRV